MSNPETNVDTNEISKFADMADTWWDTDGDMAPLHAINPLRLRYIDQRAPLAGKKVLDVGCGGGILSEGLARAGAQVTGIDLAEASLNVASDHADSSGLEIEYQCIPVEALADQRPGEYDIVACMEMLEHVPDPASIVTACSQLLKPDGDLFLSTLNRNPKSFLLAIIGAEYLLNMLPHGTHEYAKFIKPSELSDWCRAAGLDIQDITGLTYNPLMKKYALGRDVDVNYLMHCHKPD